MEALIYVIGVAVLVILILIGAILTLLGVGLLLGILWEMWIAVVEKALTLGEGEE